MNYNETISNLKFISRIKSGDKLNIKFMYVQQDNIITKISRILHMENRKNTLNFVRSTLNKSFDIINKLSQSSKEPNKQMCMNIISDLELSKNGLENLKETYVLDVKFCCDMDTILQEIDAKLTDKSIKTCIKKNEDKIKAE